MNAALLCISLLLGLLLYKVTREDSVASCTTCTSLQGHATTLGQPYSSQVKIQLHSCTKVALLSHKLLTESCVVLSHSGQSRLTAQLLAVRQAPVQQPIPAPAILAAAAATSHRQQKQALILSASMLEGAKLQKRSSL